MELKEQLLSLGISEEQAGKIVEIINGNYTANSKLSEASEENKLLKSQLKERDSQLSELKESAGNNNAELKKRIEELQAANNERAANYAAEISKLKLNNAVDMALVQAGAKNLKAVRGVLELDNLKLDKDGNVTGLAETLDKVKQSDPYLFAENTAPKFSGISPAPSRDGLPNLSIDTKNVPCSVAMMEANQRAAMNNQ